MRKTLSGSLLSVPFGEAHQTVLSTAYAYDNSRRGLERFVIIQRTERGCGRFWLGRRKWAVPAGMAFVAVVPESGGYGYP
ncbi:MAG: hypothetical protein N2322_08090, partial [Terrimicrobiaceae bacterium]|nr:hypothetical protein [Terrimicrobiaceae bacterium]